MNNETDLKGIAKRIKELREKAGLSIEQLKDKLDIHSNPANWENRLCVPNCYDFMDLAELFNVSLDYLITGKEEIKLDINQAIIVLNENQYREDERYLAYSPDFMLPENIKIGVQLWYFDEEENTVTYYDEVYSIAYTPQEAIWIAEGILREKEVALRKELRDVSTPSNERSEAQS